MTSCWTTRICTVAPTTEVVVPVKTVYTTQVTTPSPKQTTVTTVTVTNYNTDMSFYLDLNAVAAAFAESRSVREFEQILNSSRYMINNLDLNRDGWVDYLRVIETRNGYYHAMLIQACLGPGLFQDVATLVAEYRPDALIVEVIGDRYLYGYNYIVRPVFIKRPAMWSSYGQVNYVVWSSPYYWGTFPSYYTQPKPIYLNHYQAYVTTYMTNHHYCHHCDYPTTPHYSGYGTMTQSYHRNDYYTVHPDQSFENRVTRTINTSVTGGISVRNAGQLRTAVAKETKKEEPKSTSTTSTPTSTSRGSSTSSSSSSSSTSSTSSSSRSTSTSATTTTKTATGTSTRSTSVKTTEKTQQRQPSTSVDTRVNKSGTTRTTIKTTDNTGRTSTVKRETNNSTRSSNATSTRTNGTSSRSSQGTSKESNPRSGQRGR